MAKPNHTNLLAETLDQLIRDNVTTASEVATFAGVSNSTVYRWIAHESQPQYDSVRQLVRHLPSRDAREAILTAFLAGTPFQFQCVDEDLDVNDDGKVDAGDALDAAIKAVHAGAESLTLLRESGNGRNYDAEQTLRTIHLLNRMVRQCGITQQVLAQIAESRSKRKLRLAK